MALMKLLFQIFRERSSLREQQQEQRRDVRTSKEWKEEGNKIINNSSYYSRLPDSVFLFLHRLAWLLFFYHEALCVGKIKRGSETTADN